MLCFIRIKYQWVIMHKTQNTYLDKLGNIILYQEDVKKIIHNIVIFYLSLGSHFVKKNVKNICFFLINQLKSSCQSFFTSSQSPQPIRLAMSMNENGGHIQRPYLSLSLSISPFLHIYICRLTIIYVKSNHNVVTMLQKLSISPKLSI